MAYSEVTISGYNASPPPDDGTQVAANEVTWAGIKTKLSDPIKSAFDTCQSNITDVIANEVEVNLWAPATTAMTFNQTAAPTHWTKDVTNDDAMLRVVSGTVGSGGTTAISALSATNIGAHTLTAAEIPAHTHTYSGTTGFVSNDHTHSGTTSSDGSHSHPYTESQINNVNRATSGSNTNQGSQSNNTSSNGSHTHTFTTSGISANHTHAYSGTTSSIGSSGSHTHAWGISPKYVDLIIATKDA